MAENFPKLITDNKTDIQGSRRTLSKLNQKNKQTNKTSWRCHIQNAENDTENLE